jgi:hypothetical protein
MDLTATRRKGTLVLMEKRANQPAATTFHITLLAFCFRQARKRATMDEQHPAPVFLTADNLLPTAKRRLPRQSTGNSRWIV